MTVSSNVRTVRHNFRLGVLNGMLSGLGEALIDPTLVQVAFVNHLSASPLLVGLVVPLRDGVWYLPQLWVSSHLQSQPIKVTYYARMSVLRVTGLGALCLAALTLHDPAWLLAVYFLGYGLYALAAGLAGLPYLEMVSKTIPPRQRGLYFAWRLTLGGLMALGASLVVRWMLSEPAGLAFPRNFGVLFSLATLAFGSAMFALQHTREPPDLTTPAPVSPGHQFRRAVMLARHDGNYLRFLTMRGALMLGSCASPFFAVFVQRQLGAPPEMVGVYLAVVAGVGLVSNMLYGRFSVRLGHRRILVLASGLGLVMSALVLAFALLAGPAGLRGMTAALCLLPIYAFLSAREAGIGVAGYSLLMEISPPAERSVYLGFSNSILGIILLSTSLSGLVVEYWGFTALVGLTLAAYLIALAAALTMRDAPLERV
jgi:Na+/melibiose symporter-like transporter